jgi:3-deoxy-D-manno-octulosonic acid kinase
LIVDNSVSLRRSDDGALLFDTNAVGSLLETAGEAIFDPDFWSARGNLRPASAGRGTVWFFNLGAQEYVLRHFSRGGWMARMSADRYLWSGASRVRSFAEWRLTFYLHRLGMPVPVPVAAGYRRDSLTYRCDLITRRIPNSVSLSARLAETPLTDKQWQNIGAAIARLHVHGVDHADLNAHNILVDRDFKVSVIDFDRGRLRKPGAWQQGNLSRLRRSLDKISAQFPADRFGAHAWTAILMGYGS